MENMLKSNNCQKCEFYCRCIEDVVWNSPNAPRIWQVIKYDRLCSVAHRLVGPLPVTRTVSET